MIKKIKRIKRSHSNMKYRILTYKNVSMRMCEWARELEINPHVLYDRLKSGMNNDRIFTKGLLYRRK